MCLLVNRSSHGPLKNSNIRWKVLRYFPMLSRTDLSISAFSLYRSTCWRTNIWNKASNEDLAEPENVGFHVLLKKQDAVNYCIEYIKSHGSLTPEHKVFIAKIEVKKHNASGRYSEFPCETWFHAKLLKAYTPSGRHDITHRFG